MKIDILIYKWTDFVLMPKQWTIELYYISTNCPRGIVFGCPPNLIQRVCFVSYYAILGLVIFIQWKIKTVLESAMAEYLLRSIILIKQRNRLQKKISTSTTPTTT